MFRNKAIQVSMVNTKKKDKMTDAETEEVITVDPSEIAKIATEYTIKTIGTIGAVIAANKVLNTICEVSIIAAKSKFK